MLEQHLHEAPPPPPRPVEDAIDRYYQVSSPFVIIMASRGYWARRVASTEIIARSPLCHNLVKVRFSSVLITLLPFFPRGLNLSNFTPHSDRRRCPTSLIAWALRTRTFASGHVRRIAKIARHCAVRFVHCKFVPAM